mmetsp:Transcript_18395/g.17506  ORF Transcript_18395/g.17506 Transcript_18395/m.17506 type:complete len:110 (-) Transcript_18395:528-857(-)
MFCAEFLEAYFGKEMIERDLYVNAAELVIQSGIENKFPNNDTMRWADPEWVDEFWLGQGMGSSGVMHRLFKVPELLQNPTYLHHMEETVKFWMGRQGDNGQVYDYTSDD